MSRTEVLDDILELLIRKALREEEGNGRRRPDRPET